MGAPPDLPTQEGASSDRQGERMGPHQNFTTAAAEATRHLHEQTGIACWAVSRLTAGRQTFLNKKVEHPKLQLDAWLPLRESICAHMLETNGPRAVGDLAAQPTYAGTHLARTLPARAYIAAPIHIEPTASRGGLFGTLCGFDPDPQPSIEKHLAAVDEHAAHLGSLLDYELPIIDASRHSAPAELASRVANRRSWYDAMTVENDRSWRYGDAASVLVLETSASQLAPTIDVVLGLMQPSSFVAELSAESLGILAPLCDTRMAQRLIHDIATAAAAHHLHVAGGYATREPLMKLGHTWTMANAAIAPLAAAPAAPRARQLVHAAI